MSFGKYTYEEIFQDGDKIAEVWIATIEEFDYDWAWLCSPYNDARLWWDGLH